MATAAGSVPKAEKASFTGLIVPALFLVLAIILYFTLDTEVAAPGFTLWHFLALAAILFLAGVMSGLAGFGFAAPGALSTFLLPPVTAIPMLQGLSACNQMMSISKLRADMPKTLRQWFPHGPGPLIIGGLAGVWSGVWLLNNLSAPVLMIILGTLIAGYSTYMIAMPASLRIKGFDGAASGIGVGVLGGVVGGFTAQPAMLPIVWAGLRGLTKMAQRALVQPYILTLQIAAITTNAMQHPDNFGERYWTMLALTVPVVLPGTLTGVWLYRRLSEVNFQRVSLGLLGVGGVLLIIKALPQLL